MTKYHVITIEKDLTATVLGGEKVKNYSKGDVFFQFGKVEHVPTGEVFVAVFDELDEEHYLVSVNDCSEKVMNEKEYLAFVQDLVGPEYEVFGLEK